MHHNAYTSNTRRVLEVMGDDDIALCLTPQAFHNVHVRELFKLHLLLFFAKHA